MSRRHRYQSKRTSPPDSSNASPITLGEQLLSELLALYRHYDACETIGKGKGLKASAARLQSKYLRQRIREARLKIRDYIAQEARGEKMNA